MIARVTTYEDVDLDLHARVAPWIEEHAVPAFAELPGYHGSLTLLDRATRRLVGIGFYETQEAADGVAAAMEDLVARHAGEIPAEVAGMMSMVPTIATYEVVSRDGVAA